MSQIYIYKMVAGELTPVNIGARPFSEEKVNRGLNKQYAKFQERFKLWLKTNGMSQAEFTRLMQAAAEREEVTLAEDWISFSASSTSKWYNGKFCPDRGRLDMIARYMGVPIEWLKGRTRVNSITYRDKNKKAAIFHVNDRIAA